MIENLSTRLIAMIVGALLIVGLLVFGVRQCEKRRSEAAQARVERSQGAAASNSAADAIGTVARSGEAEGASEALTRSNERDIRNAQGSSDPVNPAARDAGIAALCQRAAYRNDPRCKGGK